MFERHFILVVVYLKIFQCYSECVSCSSMFYRTCLNCSNEFPQDRSHVEQVSINCNHNRTIFESYERFYSIIQSYSTRNCSMKIFYLDQFTLWNYLESLSITYGHLTRLSPVIFNRSLSIQPILYSIKNLNFSHNSFKIIQRNFSYFFPSLEKLDLSHNRIVFIRKRAFQYFHFLKELYLNNNQLKHISSTILPRQSIRLINLKSNPWFCSCQNVLTLSMSRPVPVCQSPQQYAQQNAGDIARQCFLRSKAIIFIETDDTKFANLTCALSSTIDIWKNKTNSNVTLRSAWHVEQQRPITIEYLYALSRISEKYLICFNPNSTHSESIETIIPLKLPVQTMTTTSRTLFVLESSNKFSSFLISILNTSKNLLPKVLRTSDKQILLIWLVLLIFAFMLLTFLIGFIYFQRRKARAQRSPSISQLVDSSETSPDYQTVFNLKFHCRNHKCLCQYRRHAHSSLYLTKNRSVVLSNLDLNTTAQPLLIEPIELRYAKIKRLSSIQDFPSANFLTGQFRTIVKLKSLPA